MGFPSFQTPHLPWLNDDQAPLVGNLGGVKYVISEQTTQNIWRN